MLHSLSVTLCSLSCENLKKCIKVRRRVWDSAADLLWPSVSYTLEHSCGLCYIYDLFHPLLLPKIPLLRMIYICYTYLFNVIINSSGKSEFNLKRHSSTQPHRLLSGRGAAFRGAKRKKTFPTLNKDKVTPLNSTCVPSVSQVQLTPPAKDQTPCPVWSLRSTALCTCDVTSPKKKIPKRPWPYSPPSHVSPLCHIYHHPIIFIVIHDFITSFIFQLTFLGERKEERETDTCSH